jgi:predicted secreted Zn-dependent protease
METTFDKFITNNVKQKALFDKEYAEFSRSERTLENLDRERQPKPFVVKRKVGHKGYTTV